MDLSIRLDVALEFPELSESSAAKLSTSVLSIPLLQQYQQNKKQFFLNFK